ncbi:type I restriction endonuclease subunit R [Methanosphaera cuniculi]|uniref:type I restriction endonuclease subunit R n=1 Tax=Methanosphaera cuniculi TaxID=1077256 RepID=UPI0026EF51D8|nr:type I restriction endonuclease subunit R [Methanosphaera cuniculi]
MVSEFKEENYEEAILELFEDKLGYQVESGYDINRDYENPLYMDVVEESLFEINPDIPHDVINETILKLQDFGLGSVTDKNIIFSDYLQNGIEISHLEDNEEITYLVKLVDYDNIENNDFRVVNQWTITNNSQEEVRRPDVIVFLNGLPVVVMELKSPSREDVDVSEAYTQLKNQIDKIPNLFYYNAFCVMSNLAINKVGTITSSEDRFMEWKSIDGSYESTEYADFNTFFEGIFEKKHFVDILKNFLLYSRNDGLNPIKILGAYHQYFAVHKAVNSTVDATCSDHKAGVFWHTQGSGKSLSMVFYVHLLDKIMKNPTFVIVTDRTDLDDQLFIQFSNCSNFLRQEPIQADSREDLKNLLNNRQANGIFFTTIQKFDEYTEPLSNREDIIVIVDEAHRSQYGLETTIDLKTGRKKIGAARRLRDALPNATYIGFTGTPLFKDKNTREIFGNYIDIYDMTQSVKDKATVPIYYEDRVVNLKLDEEILNEIDQKYDELAKNAEISDIQRSKKELSRMEVILGSDETIQTLVNDIIEHYENNREFELTGKAMIVAYSRNIAMKIYAEILKQRPDWNEKINIVMTSSNKDPEEWHSIIGTKAHKNELARKFKDNNDPFKIAIVVDMWLTGFDVPSLSTMYVYKPMIDHSLMQAIARVNRVYKDKEGGLIVDYIGLTRALKQAMQNYTKDDQKNYGDMSLENTAYPEFQKQLEICEDLFYGYNFSDFYKESNLKRADTIKGGANFILSKNTEESEDEYLHESLKLKQALSLCRSKTTEDERTKAAYFLAVRSLLLKITKINNNKISINEINDQINELLKHSIKNEGIINLFKTNKKEISLFNDEFLQQIKQMPEKNIAQKILEKLIKENITKFKKTNLVKSEQFSKLLNDTISKYINGHISNEEVIQELIEIGNKIKQEKTKGKKLGLTPEEQAFYDAITKPKGIKDFYNNEELIKMTQELTDKLNKTKTIDWRKKRKSRAKMKTIVKRLLKEYNYPPDEIPDAMEIVIKQCELMADNI